MNANTGITESNKTKTISGKDREYTSIATIIACINIHVPFYLLA